MLGRMKKRGTYSEDGTLDRRGELESVQQLEPFRDGRTKEHACIYPQTSVSPSRLSGRGSAYRRRKLPVPFA